MGHVSQRHKAWRGSTILPNIRWISKKKNHHDLEKLPIKKQELPNAIMSFFQTKIESVICIDDLQNIGIYCLRLVRIIFPKEVHKIWEIINRTDNILHSALMIFVYYYIYEESEQNTHIFHYHLILIIQPLSQTNFCMLLGWMSRIDRTLDVFRNVYHWIIRAWPWSKGNPCCVRCNGM